MSAILVPAHNNWPLVGSLARGGYRDFLKAGVRLFEWQGPMIHAKTAVADGVWSRIGSSNLNAASLLGNWEIDIGVLDRKLARQLEGLFLADLASSVEIVLPASRPALQSREKAAEPEQRPIEPPGRLTDRLEHWRHSPDRGGWRISDLVRAGSTLGDAIAGRRLLEREARTVLGTAAGILIGLSLLSAFFPRTVAWTFAAVLGWLGLTAGARAWAEADEPARVRHRREPEGRTPVRRPPPRSSHNLKDANCDRFDWFGSRLPRRNGFLPLPMRSSSRAQLPVVHHGHESRGSA